MNKKISFQIFKMNPHETVVVVDELVWEVVTIVVKTLLVAVVGLVVWLMIYVSESDFTLFTIQTIRIK